MAADSGGSLKANDWRLPSPPASANQKPDETRVGGGRGAGGEGGEHVSEIVFPPHPIPLPAPVHSPHGTKSPLAGGEGAGRRLGRRTPESAAKPPRDEFIFFSFFDLQFVAESWTMDRNAAIGF